jgi:hypothetical protein
VWSARLRKLRFSMDNMGLINRKPDAPKNVLERVVLQAVEGDNLVTKTEAHILESPLYIDFIQEIYYGTDFCECVVQMGYPTLRTFNSNSQQVSKPYNLNPKI